MVSSPVRSTMGKDRTSRLWGTKVSSHKIHWIGSLLKALSFSNFSCLVLYLLRADDLRHLMAVRLDLHNKFAEENEMSSFLISAKSGDQIKQAFYKIAALLAGKKRISVSAIESLIRPAYCFTSSLSSPNRFCKLPHLNAIHFLPLNPLSSHSTHIQVRLPGSQPTRLCPLSSRPLS
jgi:hypothetical protein